MLLEALIAILIFSIGILAIVGMQGSAVKASSDAKYRSDAGMQANNLIAQMWVSDRTATMLKTNFQGGNGTDGTQYTAWTGSKTSPSSDSVFGTLPGSITNPPKVTVSATGVVNIEILWQAPGDSTAHKFFIVTQIE